MATAVSNFRTRSTYNASLLWGIIPPVTATAIAPSLPPLAATWLLAIAIYAMFKIWTLQNLARATHVPLVSAIAYLLAWPGMNPRAFVDRDTPVAKPTRRDWLWASSETLLGAILIWGVAPRLIDHYPLLTGWIGLVGLAFLLHFGLLHLVALAWRLAGVPVEPIMKAPLVAGSVSEFWSHRWNLAFRDLAQVFFFRPFVSRVGIAGAMMIVFAMSGLIHDLVISVPSGGGHGLPSLYFLAQGIAVLAEKSNFGRRIGLGQGITGRTFAWLVVVPGAYWLFHPTFVREVVLPTLTFLHAF